MLWSKLFIPTLRENPADAESPGHRLLLRAGYIRRLSPGVYSHLFLGQRALRRIRQLIRSEMDAMGAQEFLLPATGMTHEQAMTAIARAELRSYKQLPQIWYRIQATMDSCSFDVDAAALDTSYGKHCEAWRRIFARCGLEPLHATAGSRSMEFMAVSDAGQDLAVTCPRCLYAATLDTAVTNPAPLPLDDPDTRAEPAEFPTPGRKTIAEVAEFTRLPETSQIKSLVMVADGEPVLALLRGEHHLSKAKFAQSTHASDVRQARPDEIRQWFGADPGSLGPVGVTGIRIVADLALEARRNMIAGANRNDYHLRNVTPGRDFKPDFADIRQAAAGDLCARCGEEVKLLGTTGIGHISKPDGAETALAIGSYGIAIERLLTCAAEQNHDEAGMCLPPAIAPFSVIVTPVNNADAALREAARGICNACIAAGIDALYDDRDERPGVKFKDADLIGVPWRVTVGKKLAQGAVELVARKGRISRDIPVAEVVSELDNRSR